MKVGRKRRREGEVDTKNGLQRFVYTEQSCVLG